MNLSKLGKIQLNFYESTNVFAFYESNSTHLLYVCTVLGLLVFTNWISLLEIACTHNYFSIKFRD